MSARQHQPRHNCLLREPARLFGISTSRLILDYLEGLNTPRSLAVWMIYSSGDHNDLLSLSLDMDAYTRPGHPPWLGIDALRRDYAATKLLKKADFLRLDIDREAVALSAGRRAEALCSRTNARFRQLRQHPGMIPDGFNAVLHRAGRLVAEVLGPCPEPRDFLDVFGDIDWTPGRTSSVTSRFRHGTFKYQANLVCTGGALSLAFALVNSSPLWAQAALDADGPCCVLRSTFQVCDHNVAITVPKNAKTDRLICYEPHINTRLQRSVGVYIRERLCRKAGLNLTDQTMNQDLAWAGSVFGTFATLDLSMASDTLSRELVRELLPESWYVLLDSLRSRSTLWSDSSSVDYNAKFSSMGNGFTFELETLVFWALACAASVSGFCVAYGDDLVVHSHDYHSVVAALSGAGFIVNDEKSFSTGLFRESCGEDYYAGVNITAPHLDCEILTVEDVVLFHNQVYRWNLREKVTSIYWSRLLRRWRRSINAVAPSVKRAYSRGIPLGPAFQGSVHFEVNFEESLPCRSRGDGWEGHVYYSISKRFSNRLEPCAGTFRDSLSGRSVSGAAVLAQALGPAVSNEGGLTPLFSSFAPLTPVLERPLGRSKAPYDVHKEEVVLRHLSALDSWPSVLYH